MTRKVLTLTLAVVTSIATGCEKKTVSPAPLAWRTPPAMMRKVASFSRATGLSAFVGGGAANNFMSQQEMSQRYIAERDTLSVTTSASQLQSAWESTVAFCATIQCEVVSSSITKQTSESAASGSVSVRVAPDDLQKLILHIQQVGKIVQHNTERQDETASVVDTDARIKNLTAFRDNLRAMLAKPNLTVDNLVEISKQLTDTQADLDSQTAQRKILANETEKIAVDISFSSQSAGSTGIFADIWNALLDAGTTFVSSVATLITVVIFLVPWAIALFLLVWLIKVRRRARQRRASPPSGSTRP